MDVQTIHDLAAVWYADRMAEEWSPPSATESEAIFRRFGLTGSFWRLA